MARALQTVGFLVVLACAVVVAGCKDREREEALLEAEEARMSLVKVQAALTRAKREVADLKEELLAVKETRRELQTQVDQIIKEHGTAVAEAGNAEERIRQLTAQSDGQAESVSALQKEIAALKVLTETQQATIEELQATIEQLQGTSEEEQDIMEESEEPITEPGAALKKP